MGDKNPKIKNKTTAREPNRGKLGQSSENLLLGTKEELIYEEISWRDLGDLTWKELADR